MQRHNRYVLVLSLLFVSIQLLGCGGGSKKGTLTISGTLPATGAVGTAYSGSLSAVGGVAPFTWTVTGLPAGVNAPASTSATQTVTGTPTAAGTSTVSVGLTDSSGLSATQSFMVVISAPPALSISGSFPATGTVGAAYTGSLTASGGTAPYTWVVTGFPATITASGTTSPTVTVSGIPTAAGTFNVSAVVTDSAAGTATSAVTVVISVPGALSIRLPSGYPLTATVGTAYTAPAPTVTGGVPPFTFAITQNKPAGLSIDPATGIVSGTPTTAGTFHPTIRVTDSATPANVGNTNYTLVISAAGALTITGSFPATGTVGAAYTGSLTVSGGTAPYTWVVTGFPATITASGTTTPTVTVSGTPTAAGTFNVSAVVTDSAAGTATSTATVVISVPGALSIRLPSGYPLTATVGTAYTAPAPTVTGGVPPFTFAITQNTPPGLSIDPATGIVTGTPTTAGTFNPTIRVTDSATPANVGNTNYMLVISPAGAVAACAATPALRGNESALTLPFAFVLRGADGSDLPVAWAGSFTPDGAGGITAADLDFVGRTNGPSNFTVQLSGSSYSFGADGRGCLYLAISGTTGAARPERQNKPNVIPVTPNVTFSFSLNTALNTGRITEFDLVTVASGQMHQQTGTDFALADLAANFAFGFDGWATDVAAEDRVAIAGSFANAAGALSSGTADDNVKGVASGELSGGNGTLVAPSGATGRGTGTYSLSATGPTFHFVYYVVNGSDLFVISSDDPTTQGNFILSGRALKASATSVALNGFYMAAVSGFDPATGGGNVVTIATLNVLANGTVPTATSYTNDRGTFQMQTFTNGTFTLDAATGRVAVAAIGSTPVAYLTATADEDGITGFVVGSGSFVSSGFLALQSTSAPNFLASDLSGLFAFGTAEDVAGLQGSSVGTYTFDGLGGYTGTVDSVTVTGGVSSPNTVVSGTYAINPDGSGTLDTTKEFVTSGTLILAIDKTSATTQPLLYILAK